jgi:hypothetical protein
MTKRCAFHPRADPHATTRGAAPTIPDKVDNCFLQCLEEPLPIRLIAEHELAPMPAIHDLVNGSWIFQVQGARHAQRVYFEPMRRQLLK